LVEFLPLQRMNADPIHFDAPGFRPKLAADQLQQGSFSGAAWSHDRRDFALGNIQVDPVENQPLAAMERQVAHGDCDNSWRRFGGGNGSRGHPEGVRSSKGSDRQAAPIRRNRLESRLVSGLRAGKSNRGHSKTGNLGNFRLERLSFPMLIPVGDYPAAFDPGKFMLTAARGAG
jgi:hypothetical protein